MFFDGALTATVANCVPIRRVRASGIELKRADARKYQVYPEKS